MAKYKIMYIEPKEGVAALEARIGKVYFSKTAKTLRYQGREFQAIRGYKANYEEVETGDEYWISGCRKDGNDGLYKTTVLIDEDICCDYWTTIRGLPERRTQKSFTSLGKYRKRTRQPQNAPKNL